MKLNRRVRAILCLEQSDILLIKRTKPDRPSYWVAPGGGVESDDDSLESALYREISEEIGGEIDIHKLVYITEKPAKNDPQMVIRQHYFFCTLKSYDFTQRNGPEFSDPANGLYEVDIVPCELEYLQTLNILSEDLKQFLINNHQRLHELPDLRANGHYKE